MVGLLGLLSLESMDRRVSAARREFSLSRGKKMPGFCTCCTLCLEHVPPPYSGHSSLFKFQVMDHFLFSNSHHPTFTILQEGLRGLSAPTVDACLSQHYPTPTTPYWSFPVDFKLMRSGTIIILLTTVSLVSRYSLSIVFINCFDKWMNKNGRNGKVGK